MNAFFPFGDELIFEENMHDLLHPPLPLFVVFRVSSQKRGGKFRLILDVQL